MNKIIPAPIDAHLHLRHGPELRLIGDRTDSNGWGACIVMPNVDCYEMNKWHGIEKYYNDIMACGWRFRPLITMRLSDGNTVRDLVDCFNVLGKGLFAGVKLYFKGTTTGSHGVWGISWNNGNWIEDYSEVFYHMNRLDIPLLIHAEVPGISDEHAEQAFIPFLKELKDEWPDLRIIIEHVSTAMMLKAIREFRIHGTVTLHHMMLTDINTKCIYNYCKPKAKTEADRLAVIASIHDPWIMFGSDSAYHTISRKEAGAAGCYTSPYLLPMLIDVMEENNMLDYLEDFTHNRASSFYDVKTKLWTRVHESGLLIPEFCDGVPAFRALRKLKHGCDIIKSC
jgi:dihydroorotase